jgi:hypothetical protein
MNQNIVKGILTSCKYETKYDLNGVSFKDYILIIENQKYTAQVKESIYLQDGMTVVLEINPNSKNEVISGLCIKEGYRWGPNPGKLKKEISPFEKYGFLEGTILEKRKSTTGSIYMNRSALSNRGSRVSYTIVLAANDFHVSRDEGEYLQVGMNIAVVLNKKDSVLILDKGANKYLGLSKPYFIIFLLALIAFNGYMYYLNHTNQTHTFNFNVTLVIINIFLIAAFLLSLATFYTTNSAKKFLLSAIKK